MPLETSAKPCTQCSRTDLAKYKKLFRELVDPTTTRTFSPPREYEQVPMSGKDFHRLKKILEDSSLGSDRRFPSFSWNARTSMGTVEWIPISVHEDIASAFIGRHEVAVELLPPATAQRLVATGSQAITGFLGEYQGSNKEPDVLFKYEEENGNVIYTCTVEIGLEETYEELVEDAKQWIEGQREVQMVILVKLEEIPFYRCPTRTFQDKEIEALCLPHFSAIKPDMFRLQNPADIFGPLQLRNLTGFAERQGDRTYFLGADHEIAELDIKLSDLYPIDAVDGGNIKLPLTWDRLRSRLEKARYQLAMWRCQKMLQDLAKRQDNVNDRDYLA